MTILRPFFVGFLCALSATSRSVDPPTLTWLGEVLPANGSLRPAARPTAAAQATTTAVTCVRPLLGAGAEVEPLRGAANPALRANNSGGTTSVAPALAATKALPLEEAAAASAASKTPRLQRSSTSLCMLQDHLLTAVGRGDRKSPAKDAEGSQGPKCAQGRPS
mmetsp:Transcript_59944/g.128657  ORF Transcript_59944/g.128657 Transcript_59944/m.128657 type:complete len:164 (-) Transcript_59944:3-494(-)